jgi:hypothetical protein
VEQNFKKQTTGYHCDHLRRRPGATDKNSCVAVFFDEGAVKPLETDLIRACALKEGASIQAYYIKNIDLARYGRVDQLAPAGAMAEFADYVARQDREEALTLFTELTEQEDAPCTVEVLYGKKSVSRRLEKLRAEKDSLQLFCYRKK